MLQCNDGELSDLVNKTSLHDEERKPISGNQNRNRRRGINSHLYNKPNSGRGGGRRGSPNNRPDDSDQQNRQNNRGRGGRGRGENVPNNSQEHRRQNNDDDISSYKTFPAGSLKFQDNADPYPPRYDPMNNGDKSQKKRNTETFKPSHRPTDMRITAAFANSKKYTREITSRDVISVQGLFCEENDLTIYNKLLDETNSGVDFSNLWQLWHGDTHVIADDKKGWKDSCPTFNMVLEKVETYFDMNIQATRLNWYRDSSEWKPFHHDAAAVNPKKEKVQNFTVAVSFGAERDAAFEHATTRTVISMPQPNGTIYTFGKDINVLWRHGILQVPPDKFHDKGRISIIAWGSVRQTLV